MPEAVSESVRAVNGMSVIHSSLWFWKLMDVGNWLIILSTALP